MCGKTQSVADNRTLSMSAARSMRACLRSLCMEGRGAKAVIGSLVSEGIAVEHEAKQSISRR